MEVGATATSVANPGASASGSATLRASGDSAFAFIDIAAWPHDRTPSCPPAVGCRTRQIALASLFLLLQVVADSASAVVTGVDRTLQFLFGHFQSLCPVGDLIFCAERNPGRRSYSARQPCAPPIVSLWFSMLRRHELVGSITDRTHAGLMLGYGVRADESEGAKKCPLGAGINLFSWRRK